MRVEIEYLHYRVIEPSKSKKCIGTASPPTLKHMMMTMSIMKIFWKGKDL